MLPGLIPSLSNETEFFRGLSKSWALTFRRIGRFITERSNLATKRQHEAAWNDRPGGEQAASVSS